MDTFIIDVVPKGHHLTSFTVNLRVSAHVMLQLTVEVVMANTLDVKFFLSPINSDIEWVIRLHEGVSLFNVMCKSCISYSILVFMELIFVSNRFLELEHHSFKEARETE